MKNKNIKELSREELIKVVKLLEQENKELKEIIEKKSKEIKLHKDEIKKLQGKLNKERTKRMCTDIELERVKDERNNMNISSNREIERLNKKLQEGGIN